MVYFQYTLIAKLSTQITLITHYGLLLSVAIVIGLSIPYATFVHDQNRLAQKAHKLQHKIHFVSAKPLPTPAAHWCAY